MAGCGGSATLSTSSQRQGVAITLDRIALSKSSVTLAQETTWQFSATGYNTLGGQMSITPDWSLSNSSVGTVSTAGLFTASSEGTVTLTVSQDGISDEVSITVTSADLSSISITVSSTTMIADQEQTFTATGLDSDGNTVDADPTWSVVGSIGIIDSDTGNFLAINAGVGSVLALYGDQSASTSITVITNPNSSFSP